jgi:hypothetical protein
MSRIKMFRPFNFCRKVLTANCESFPRRQTITISLSSDSSCSNFASVSSFSRSAMGMLMEFSSEQMFNSGSVRTSTSTCFGLRASEKSDAEIRSDFGKSLMMSSLSVALAPQNCKANYHSIQRNDELCKNKNQLPIFLDK